jgi:hypothetical protein
VREISLPALLLLAITKVALTLCSMSDVSPLKKSVAHCTYLNSFGIHESVSMQKSQAHSGPWVSEGLLPACFTGIVEKPGTASSLC